MHASWNALVKAEDEADRLASMATLAAVGAVCSIPLVFVAELPARASWPWLAASICLHTCYCLFLVKAYQHGDLSSVYPLARGSAPPLVLVGGVVLLGESLGATQLLAVALVSCGVASLVRGGAGQRRALGWAFATGVVIATYSMVDGVGVRKAGSALGYIAVLDIGFGVVVTTIALLKCRSRTLAYARREWRRGLGGGVLCFGAYALVLWAFQLGALAPVVALRETSVVFAAVIGARILGEPLGSRRLAAAAIVALGVVLLQL